MKKAKFFWLLLILAVAALWVLFHKSVTQTAIQQAQTTNAINPAIVPANTLAPRQLTATAADTNSNISKSPPEIVAEYRQGQITKSEAMNEIVLNKNTTSQDTYGKIVDQYGQPVVGADVTGNLMLEQGLDSDETVKVFKTQSDAEGLFQFTGLQGAQLGVTAKKDGYLLGEHGEGYKAPVGGTSSPDDRVILTMWKLHESEKIISGSFESVIPSDGTPIRFDTLTQKPNPDGDLRVTLLRSPSDVRRSGQRFDWDVKIEMLNGGLVIENDPYPYWAAENGYEPSFEENMSSNNVPWLSKLTQNFYTKNSDGQFGRIQVNVYSALTPAKIRFDFWVNPSGSQNLEPAQ